MLAPSQGIPCPRWQSFLSQHKLNNLTLSTLFTNRLAKVSLPWCLCYQSRQLGRYLLRNNAPRESQKETSNALSLEVFLSHLTMIRRQTGNQDRQPGKRGPICWGLPSSIEISQSPHAPKPKAAVSSELQGSRAFALRRRAGNLFRPRPLSRNVHSSSSDATVACNSFSAWSLGCDRI